MVRGLCHVLFYCLMRNEAEALINLEEDMQRRCVLWRYYILGESWEKVAEKMKFSLRQIQRLHGGALLDVERNVGTKCH